jgi:hypothetical protein
VPAEFFLERKAAICAQLREILDKKFTDLSVGGETKDNQLVYAKGPLRIEKEPFDPVLGVKAE